MRVGHMLQDLELQNLEQFTSYSINTVSLCTDINAKAAIATKQTGIQNEVR